MFKKIKAYLMGPDPGGSKLSYVERQIDEGKFILEMMDRARVLEMDVTVVIEVGEVKRQMVCHARAESVDDIYEAVRKGVGIWIERYSEEQGDEAAARVRQEIERKCDRDEIEKGSRSRLGLWWNKVRQKR